MLQSVSWSQYFILIFFATLAYYLFVWVTFFKATLSFIPSITKLRSVSSHHEDAPDEVMATAQHILDELRPVFDDRTNKNELLYALQLRLRKYNEWTEPGFRETITAFIRKESQSKCSIHLSEEEERLVWL